MCLPGLLLVVASLRYLAFEERAFPAARTEKRTRPTDTFKPREVFLAAAQGAIIFMLTGIVLALPEANTEYAYRFALYEHGIRFVQVVALSTIAFLLVRCALVYLSGYRQNAMEARIRLLSDLYRWNGREQELIGRYAQKLNNSQRGKSTR